jgi:peptidoglycan hydrolase-like protein with peptidoglycan-binding domain
MPLIALAAAAALAVPAAAQQQPGASQNQSTDQTGAADQGKEAQAPAARPTRSQTRMLQTQLNRMGLDAGPADGIMGTKTRAALEKFQTQKGLNASGQIDRETMTALRSLRGQSALARRSRQGGSPQPQPDSQPQSQPDQNAPK